MCRNKKLKNIVPDISINNHDWAVRSAIFRMTQSDGSVPVPANHIELPFPELVVAGDKQQLFPGV